MPRLMFDWQRGHSESSSRAWEARWERAWENGEEGKLGPKGQAYIEAKYGAEVQGEEPPDDIFDDYESPFDIEGEY